MYYHWWPTYYLIQMASSAVLTLSTKGRTYYLVNVILQKAVRGCRHAPGDGKWLWACYIGWLETTQEMIGNYEWPNIRTIGVVGDRGHPSEDSHSVETPYWRCLDCFTVVRATLQINASTFVLSTAPLKILFPNWYFFQHGLLYNQTEKEEEYVTQKT